MGRVSLLIVGIHAGISELGIGEGHQLTFIGGIGQDLLVAGHPRIKNNLSNRCAAVSKAHAGQDRAISEDEVRFAGWGIRHLDRRHDHLPFILHFHGTRLAEDPEVFAKADRR